MTSKTIEKLFDLKSQLANIKTDFKEHPATKSRFGSLVITKLEEARHWLNDLIDEAVEAEEKEK
mgnify:CR=1 FL=1